MKTKKEIQDRISRHSYELSQIHESVYSRRLEGEIRALQWVLEEAES